MALSLIGNLFYLQMDATALGAAGLKSTTGVNVKLQLDYRPTTDDSVQVIGKRADTILTPQGYVSAINIVNLGYQHQLEPALSAVFTISDFFDGQRIHRSLVTASFTQQYP